MEKGNQLYHKLDRLIGIPLIQALRVFTFGRKKVVPQHINKIAILNLGSIGDNILMSAAIADLRSAYKQADIVVFTGNTNFQAVKLISGIDKIIKLPITNFIKACSIIRNEGLFDVLIDYGPWPRINAIYSFFFKADCKIGFNSHAQYRHYLYDIAIRHSSLKHEIDNFRSLIKPIYQGFQHNPNVNIQQTKSSVHLIQGLGRYCIVHPWPGGYKSYMKEWPQDRWKNLIGLIAIKFDHILLSGSKADAEKTKQLVELLPSSLQNSKVINIAGQYNLQEIAHIISEAELVISVNTGISHITAALEKKQVCLHGPTNIIRWGPYSENTISVVPSIGIFGYLNFGYEYNKAQGNCMEHISVEEVIDSINKLQGYDNINKFP